MAAAEPDSIPCPLCRHNLAVRWTFKEKPYVVCNDCGVQLFIRAQEGIERLAQLIHRQRQQRGRV